jgi:hydroxyacylglutathione hydrolase
MLNIRQFRYSADNLSYLIFGETSALAVDPGAVNAIEAFLTRQGLTLKYVVNTHDHPDHTPGNRDILRRTHAEYLENRFLRDQAELTIDNEHIRVISTPGHTEDSLTFSVGRYLITGDTLFNGTVGNCFSGDLEAFYKSIKTILVFPDDTVIYAGHDYVRVAVDYAKTIEPGNPDMDRYFEMYDPYHVFSTLEWERRVNPYLRFNDESVIALLKQRNLPSDTEFDRWTTLMEEF